MTAPLMLGVLAWQVGRPESLDAYAARLDQEVRQGVAAGAELLLMPEYAAVEVASAFACAGVAAEMEAMLDEAGTILAIQRACAMRHRVWLLPGTRPVRRDGIVVNQAPLIAPDGRMAVQEKRVMTRFETEDWHVQPGRPPGVVETPWGLIGIAICYDVEFPALVRGQVEAGAWLVLVPSCTETQHGAQRVEISARARALENQCFVAVAPTVGEAPWLATLDRNSGRAGVFGPIDRGFAADGVVAVGSPDQPGWLVAELDAARLDVVRRDGGVLNHRDWPAAVPPAPVLAFT